MDLLNFPRSGGLCCRVGRIFCQPRCYCISSSISFSSKNNKRLNFSDIASTKQNGVFLLGILHRNEMKRNMAATRYSTVTECYVHCTALYSIPTELLLGKGQLHRFTPCQ